jgi:hypothetical protein
MSTIVYMFANRRGTIKRCNQTSSQSSEREFVICENGGGGLKQNWLSSSDLPGRTFRNWRMVSEIPAYRCFTSWQMVSIFPYPNS